MHYEITDVSRIVTLIFSTMYSKKSLILLKIGHTISFLLGLAPFSISISPCSSRKTGYNLRITYSRLGCAYNVLLIFIFVGITFVVTPRLVEWQYADHSVFAIVVAAITTIGNITTLIVIFHYTIYQHQSIAIGNQISEFDERYGSKFLHIFEDDKAHRFRNIQHWLTIFLFALLWCGVLATSAGVEQSSASVASYFSVLVLTSFLIQYSSNVDDLRGRFKYLNKIFPTIFKYPISSLENGLFADNVSDHRLIMNNFIIFKQARNRLYKISYLLSDFYSFPVLLTIFYSCCATIDTAYYFLMYIVEAESFPLDTQCINSFFWVLICTYPTISLSRSVKIFTTEMHKTADIIYDVMEMYAANKHIEYQLNNFAVELIHKKVEFTACGFFPLDCTLLQSMFGAFVTYLLILVQFKPKDVIQK